MQRFQCGADLVGRLAGFVRQRFDLGRDDGESLAGIARPGGLDSRVQRQQIRLFGDGLDLVGDAGNGLDIFFEAPRAVLNIVHRRQGVVERVAAGRGS